MSSEGAHAPWLPLRRPDALGAEVAHTLAPYIATSRRPQNKSQGLPSDYGQKFRPWVCDRANYLAQTLGQLSLAHGTYRIEPQFTSIHLQPPDEKPAF